MGTRREIEELNVQNDNLQWELQRLTAENTHLQEEHPEVSGSWGEARERCGGVVRAAKQRVGESAKTAELSEQRAVEAEGRAA